MARGKSKKSENAKLPTKALMESFQKYCEAIRGTKPIFIRFKDGKLIKNALNHITKLQMEMLFVWFLKKKTSMKPSIGATLCKEIISDFINSSYKEYGFYNKLEQLVKIYNKNQDIGKEASAMANAVQKLKENLYNKVKPFDYKTKSQISEETALKERKKIFN